MIARAGVSLPSVASKFPDPAKGLWVAISEPVTSRLKCDWPGLTADVTVDRANGAQMGKPTCKYER